MWKVKIQLCLVHWPLRLKALCILCRGQLRMQGHFQLLISPWASSSVGLCLWLFVRCWLELAQKTMTVRGLFEGNLNLILILSLTKPSVCWRNYIAYTQQSLCSLWLILSQTGGRNQRCLCTVGEHSLLPSRCNLKRSEGEMTDVRRALCPRRVSYI